MAFSAILIGLFGSVPSAAESSNAPIVVNGMLYINSGYAQWGGLSDNVLLAFEVSNP
jgi:polyvinyl alcohol dehydrogenase (cytochrome)